MNTRMLLEQRLGWLAWGERFIGLDTKSGS